MRKDKDGITWLKLIWLLIKGNHDYIHKTISEDGLTYKAKVCRLCGKIKV